MTLDAYGIEPHERERVQLAILKISEGSEQKIREHVATAKKDYRDVLFWADPPQEAKLSPAEKTKAIATLRFYNPRNINTDPGECEGEPSMGKAKLSGNGNRVSVVKRAIASVGGSPSELAVKLSKTCGAEITRQRVHGWRLRGTFPRELMPAVERLCGIPIEELAVAKVRERNPENPVEKSIRKATPEGTPAALAEALSRISGQRFTRQMVYNWQAAEQFPTDVVPWVHLLTKIPVKELLWGRREQRFHDLDSVKGIWSKAEAEEFDAAIAPLGKIDPALWAAEPQAPYRARTPRRTRRPRR